MLLALIKNLHLLNIFTFLEYTDTKTWKNIRVYKNAQKLFKAL